MGKIVYFDNFGGPEVLKIKIIEEQLSDNQVLVRHTAIGVNAIDTMIRSGKYPIKTNTCGIEACGVIEKIGANVTGLDLGQRVAYATYDIGSYSEYRAIDPKYLVNIPDDISDETAASCLVKGLTAHYLVYRVYSVRPQVGVLVHTCTNGVGRLIAQWCKELGALVIGTIRDENKRDLALENCHYVINYKSENWLKELYRITKNIGVNVVYDSLGQETFNDSLNCLSMMGLMVSYGYLTGKANSIDLDILRRKSLFLTCPSLFDYKLNRMELVLSANEVFKRISSSILSINIGAKFSLNDVIQAHQLIESGNSNGSIILIP